MGDVIMKCGHVANGVLVKGDKRIPCCVICNCFEVMPENKKPDLSNRFAKCEYCGKITPSNWYLPFFKIRPNNTYDEYYCGCRGWD